MSGYHYDNGDHDHGDHDDHDHGEDDHDDYLCHSAVPIARPEGRNPSRDQHVSNHANTPETEDEK